MPKLNKKCAFCGKNLDEIPHVDTYIRFKKPGNRVITMGKGNTILASNLAIPLAFCNQEEVDMWDITYLEELEMGNYWLDKH